MSASVYAHERRLDHSITSLGYARQPTKKSLIRDISRAVGRRSRAEGLQRFRPTTPPRRHVTGPGLSSGTIVALRRRMGAWVASRGAELLRRTHPVHPT